MTNINAILENSIIDSWANHFQRSKNQVNKSDKVGFSLSVAQKTGKLSLNRGSTGCKVPFAYDHTEKVDERTSNRKKRNSVQQQNRPYR